MKSILLEIVLIMSAIVLWMFTLPLAAIFFVAATAWKKTGAVLIGEPPVPTDGVRMSRAIA